jgi:hypothetical protein
MKLFCQLSVGTHKRGVHPNPWRGETRRVIVDSFECTFAFHVCPFSIIIELTLIAGRCKSGNFHFAFISRAESALDASSELPFLLDLRLRETMAHPHCFFHNAPQMREKIILMNETVAIMIW